MLLWKPGGLSLNPYSSLQPERKIKGPKLGVELEKVKVPEQNKVVNGRWRRGSRWWAKTSRREIKAKWASDWVHWSLRGWLRARPHCLVWKQAELCVPAKPETSFYLKKKKKSSFSQPYLHLHPLIRSLFRTTNTSRQSRWVRWPKNVQINVMLLPSRATSFTSTILLIHKKKKRKNNTMPLQGDVKVTAHNRRLDLFSCTGSRPLKPVHSGAFSWGTRSRINLNGSMQLEKKVKDQMKSTQF